MSADANIVFFGVRISLSEDEAEAFDHRRNPLVAKARAVGLAYHMANFGGSEPLYYLFIGKPFGFTGPEHQAEVVMTMPTLEQTISLVRTQLPQVGLSEEPSLFIQWVPDA